MATARAAARGGRGTMGAKAVAVMAWFIGVWTTHEFLGPLAGGGDVLLGAFVLQAVLTAGESPLWRGAGAWWNVAVLVVDAVTNVGGFYFYLVNLDQTDSWRAFSAGLQSSSALHPLAALVVSLVLGVLVAAAPEYLWRQQ